MPRRISSRGLNLLVRLILKLPYKDTQCGAKVFKREALNSVIADVMNDEFAFDIELLYKMRNAGFRITESAITWDEKGRSSLNIADVAPGMLRAIMSLWLNSFRLSKLQKVEAVNISEVQCPHEGTLN